MSGHESDGLRRRERDDRPKGRNDGPPPSNRGWGFVNSEISAKARGLNRAGPDKTARPSQYSTIIVQRNAPSGGGRSNRAHASSKALPGNNRGLLYEEDVEERGKRKEQERERLDNPPRINPIAPSIRDSYDSRPIYSSHTIKPPSRPRAPLIVTSSRVPESRHSKRELSPVSALSKKTKDLRIVNYSDELATGKRKKEEDRRWEEQQRNDQLGIHIAAQSEYNGPGGAHDLVRVGEDMSGGAIRVPETRTASHPHHSKTASAATITLSNYRSSSVPHDSRRVVIMTSSLDAPVSRGAGRLHDTSFHHSPCQHTSSSREPRSSRRGPAPLFRESGVERGYEGGYSSSPAAAAVAAHVLITNVRRSRRGEDASGYY
ncbi:hypothetical protein DSL72_004564 [Monilinia vaccinii-corymbosi]|uniref:Uncharacterized protein n=1 Tax=Monilinia vaccinii-corymbosi TaxID=61207 RepID=A0A8A3P445_9HELO|nr:hypothetical protein DSL72_004564 [Monilinia vaccinii-corymbosi]